MTGAKNGVTSLLATAITLTIGAFGAVAQSSAQWAPGRTARLMVPFPPGGAADILGRLLAQQITTASGQGMVVENRPGGGTVIATEIVARSPADGTTLLLMANSFVINASLRASLPYDPLTGFEHICFLAQSPHVFAVNAKSAYTTFADFVADAKARPGILNIAAVGPATTHHIAIEMLKRAVGVDAAYVAFPGGAPAVTNLIGGHVTAVQANHAEVKEHLGGTLRGLAVGARERINEIPDIPTLSELGFPEVIAVSWFGLVAPAGTPRPVVTQITAQARTALDNAEITSKLVAAGMLPEGKTCGTEFTALLKTQHGRYAKAIKEAGIKEK